MMELRQVGLFAFPLLASIAFSPQSIASTTLPRVEGSRSDRACAEAYALARTMFYSTSSRLYAPLQLARNMSSTLVLGATGVDISAGDALSPSSAFRQITAERSHVYWATSTHGGKRVVVDAKRLGAMGAYYQLYLLDDTLLPQDYLASFSETAYSKTFLPMVASWRPPLVFQRGGSDELWLIDVGQERGLLADWKVYTVPSTDPVCTIDFGESAAAALARLPKHLRELARHLDDAVGPGLDEGKIQPTATLRNRFRRVLANAAVRPWAVAERDVYNTRSEVDAGLRSWSRATRSRARVFASIQGIYPRAERALAMYYERMFNLSRDDARHSARFVLDIVYRSHFTFAAGGATWRYDDAYGNPWPQREGGTISRPQ